MLLSRKSDIMKIIKLMLVFFIIMLLPHNIKAACSNSEKVKLNKLANNISYTYDYIEENNNVTFNITLSNIQPEFRVMDIQTKQDYQDFGSEITLNGYAPGNGYRFDIYSKDKSCTRDKLASIYITLPFYNSFYSNELCKGIEDYNLCQKWTKNTYSYEDSIKMTNAYIDSLKKQDNNIDDNNNKEDIKGFYDYLLEYYLKAYYIILPIIIISCLVVIYRVNQKNKLI